MNDFKMPIRLRRSNGEVRIISPQEAGRIEAAYRASPQGQEAERQAREQSHAQYRREALERAEALDREEERACLSEEHMRRSVEAVLPLIERVAPRIKDTLAFIQRVRPALEDTAEVLSQPPEAQKLIIRARKASLEQFKQKVEIRKRAEQAERENEALKAKYEPAYPLPNAAKQWTPKIVADYLNMKRGVVTHAVAVLAEREPSDPAARLYTGKPGEPQTWNARQMKRVVDYIRDRSSAYKSKRTVKKNS